MASWTRQVSPSPRTTRARLLALALFAELVFLPARSPAQSPQANAETVGRIQGDDIAVKGPASVEVESGRSVAVLASGSEVTVRAGSARLALEGGGQIDICAPAHFSLLKSGGAVTLALDYGRIRARLDSRTPLTIYTPLIVATPVAIGDAPRDSTIGLEPSSEMCALASRGALRIEQQLSGQSLLVPQDAEIGLAGGQLENIRNETGACACEVSYARSAPRPSEPLARPSPPEVSLLSRPTPAKPSLPSEKPPSLPAVEQPIYQVFMPPLTFNAASPAPPPDPDPQTMVLVRTARVIPAEIYYGHVEAAPAPAPRAVQQQPSKRRQPAKKGGFFSRVGHFFRRLLVGSP